MFTPRKKFKKTNAIGKFGEDIVKQILEEQYEGVTIFRSEGHCPGYDLAFVKENEKELRTIEVKFDLESMRTGNFFVETYALTNDRYKWIESGINKTLSDVYVFITQYYSKSALELQVMFIPTKKLKSLLTPVTEVQGGYAKATKGHLIKIEEIKKYSYVYEYSINDQI